MKHSQFARRHTRRGTAMVLGLVLAMIITGLVMTLAWAAGVQTQTTGSLVQLDASWYAAEAGAQRAAWYIKNNVAVSQPVTGTINGCTYSATWAAATGSAQRITSVGTRGSARSTVLVTVTPPTAAVQSAISVAKDLTLKNLDIIGNVHVGEDVDFDPGSASVSGNLTYGGTKSGSPDVDGTLSQGAWTGLDWTSVQSTLAAQAGATGQSGSGKTYNFNALSGSNKVIYVNGNVTNPNFVGSGTLYVNGTVTLDSGADPGSANPVNVVATGNITTNNNMTYHGSLYTKGNWNRGKINLVGSVYAEGSMVQGGNGSSSITFTSAPWFDTRTATGGGSGGTMTIANFAGPHP